MYAIVCLSYRMWLFTEQRKLLGLWDHTQPHGLPITFLHAHRGLASDTHSRSSLWTVSACSGPLWPSAFALGVQSQVTACVPTTTLATLKTHVLPTTQVPSWPLRVSGLSSVQASLAHTPAACEPWLEANTCSQKLSGHFEIKYHIVYGFRSLSQKP